MNLFIDLSFLYVLSLQVAGTIVTYELVLIQFHEDQDLWDCDQNGYS